MADIPLAVLLEGDYGYKVQVFDTGDTMAVLAEQGRGSGGRRPRGAVPARRRSQGERCRAATRRCPDDLTIADAGFVEMESVEIYRAG